MTRSNQFSMARLLIAVALVNAACWFFTDFTLGTAWSLLDGPAFLACIAAALTSLVGNPRQVCFAAAATMVFVPIGMGCFYLLLLMCSL